MKQVQGHWKPRVVTVPTLPPPAPPKVIYALFLRQWTGSALVQVMVWRLFRAKPLPESMLSCCQFFTLRDKFQWNWNQKYTIFFHKNAFENIVCEMAVILFRRKWVELNQLDNIGWGNNLQLRGIFNMSHSRLFKSFTSDYPQKIFNKIMTMFLKYTQGLLTHWLPMAAVVILKMQSQNTY